MKSWWILCPPAFLIKNKKFIYGLAKEGARAREYEDLKAFKIYLVDIGLLCALCEIDASDLIAYKNKVIPIEAKAGMVVHAQSLRVFSEKYKPEIMIRTSLKPYRIDGNMMNLPLFEVWNLREVLEFDKHFGIS